MREERKRKRGRREKKRREKGRSRGFSFSLRSFFRPNTPSRLFARLPFRIWTLPTLLLASLNIDESSARVSVNSPNVMLPPTCVSTSFLTKESLCTDFYFPLSQSP